MHKVASLTTALILLACTATAERVNWGRYIAHDDAWFKSAEGQTVIDNVLSWQSESGTWPKNGDTATAPATTPRDRIRGTYDNGATFGQVRFLGRAYAATHEARCKNAAERAIDGILEAQYDNGGWPQYYPPGDGYARHITFNDNSMINIMNLLLEVANEKEFAFVDAPRRAKAADAVQNGINCILDAQIEVDGELTAWCAQHDPETLAPALARSYEHPSISGSEGVRIVQFLMQHADATDPRVVRAIESACAWFEAAKLTGIRYVREDGERRVIQDPDAPPLWARFYEIDTNRPIFSGRDGVIKYDIAEIEAERRNGYSWYSTSPARLPKELEEWRAAR